jgi:two-component system, OmpR family, phosphate regulon sensor histidine kinase PhoR
VPLDPTFDPITPRKAGRVTATFVAVVAFACALFLEVGPIAVPGFGIALLIGLIVFLATYLAVTATLERYINARLRLLFRMVHDLRTGGGQADELDGDVLGQVQSTLEGWAREKRTEIAELTEREKYRREFIGNLSHELKTPLFNIQGYVLTLLDGGLEDPKVARDFLERAARGSDRLMKIVEDLDMISKLENGVLALGPVDSELRNVVADPMGDVQGLPGAQNMRLINSVPADLHVRVDPAKLAQVFTNLLENAIRYGKPGGEVEVLAYALDGDQVFVEVRDNGIGIAEEHLPRLFERFYRVSNSRARHEGGSGLGLAIVKHIVEAHNGTITVKSVEGQGTTFGFTLPKAH